MPTLDYPTLSRHIATILSQLTDCDFDKVVVTNRELVLTGAGFTVTLTAVRANDQLTAHFAALTLERLGFGEFARFRELLCACDELCAFRFPDGSAKTLARMHYTPPERTR